MTKPLHALILSAALLATPLFASSSFAAGNPEPSIVITHSKDKTFYEYTLNGEVVEIKVVPKVGPIYYLIPAGGDDAQFKRQTESNLVIPKWVIFSW